MPLTKPTNIAETLGIVTGASKKINPDTAMGSLLSAPTIEYVVEEVTRTHHAEVYEIKTDDSPEKIMAAMIVLRVSTGKFLTIFADDQSSTAMEATNRMGIVSRLL
jgi:hypothetical protein